MTIHMRRWMVLMMVVALGPADVPAAGPAAPDRPASRPESRAFERGVAQFLEHYRRFLECCVADPDAIPRTRTLESQAEALLEQARTGVASELKKLRGFTVQELVGPVERVRDDLRAIRKRLEQIQKLEDKLEEQELDFFTFHIERRRLQNELDAIPREFQAPRRPGGPPAGVEIGTTPSMGPEIGTVPPTGKEIGTTPPAGTDIGTTPPTGKEIGATPTTGQEIGEPRR